MRKYHDSREPHPSPPDGLDGPIGRACARLAKRLRRAAARWEARRHRLRRRRILALLSDRLEGVVRPEDRHLSRTLEQADAALDGLQVELGQ